MLNNSMNAKPSLLLEKIRREKGKEALWKTILFQYQINLIREEVLYA